MAFQYEVLRVTFGGRLFNKEIWSNSLHIGEDNQNFTWGPEPLSTSLPTDIANEIKDWFTSPQSLISNKASIDWVKFAVLGTDGKYISDPIIIDFTSDNTGASAVLCAPQLSVALTLTTDNMRGLARFGRIYPPLNAQVTDEGYAAGMPELADSFKRLIESINYLFNLGTGIAPKVIVASSAREGKNSTVTGVKVGRVIDTQRSRRNALTEDYFVQSVNPNPLTDPSP